MNFQMDIVKIQMTATIKSQMFIQETQKNVILSITTVMEILTKMQQQILFGQ